MFKSNKIISYLIIPILFIFLAGCSKQNKKIIKQLELRTPDIENTKKNIIVKIKNLSLKELKAIFRDAKTTNLKYVIREWQPIKIEIINNNEFPIYLSNKNLYKEQQNLVKMDLYNKTSSIASNAKKIAKVGTVTLLGAASYAGLLFGSSASCTGCFSGIMLIPSLAVGIVALPVTLIAYSAKKGLKYSNHKRKKRLNKSIKKNVIDLNQKIEIKQKSTLKKIMLVQRSFNKNRFVKLFNKKNNLYLEFSIK